MGGRGKSSGSNSSTSSGADVFRNMTVAERSKVSDAAEMVARRLEKNNDEAAEKLARRKASDIASSSSELSEKEAYSAIMQRAKTNAQKNKSTTNNNQKVGDASRNVSVRREEQSHAREMARDMYRFRVSDYTGRDGMHTLASKVRDRLVSEGYSGVTIESIGPRTSRVRRGADWSITLVRQPNGSFSVRPDDIRERPNRRKRPR